MNSPTKDQREAAALFYCRSLTGEQHDWVKHDNLIAEDYDIDDDIVNLAQLLADREAALVDALKKAALRNAADGPCFCCIPIPADTAHHLSCQSIRAILKKARVES